MFAKYIIWSKGQPRSFSSSTFLNAFLQNKNIYRVTVLVSVILQNLRDFLAPLYKTTETFDCNTSSSWLGNNLHVQFKSSTYFNSFMTYLNFFACSFLSFSLLSSNPLLSRAIRTVCQGGRRAPAVSPGLGTAARADCSNVAGLNGSRWSGSKRLLGSKAIVSTNEEISTKVALSKPNFNSRWVKWCFVLASFYISLYSRYSIIGSFRFPLGSPSFWFVRLVPCASTTPLPFPYRTCSLLF